MNMANYISACLECPRCAGLETLQCPGDHVFPPRASERCAEIQPLSLAITNRIPMELVERCIAWLSSDPASLYSCALVCREWYHRSTILLYHRVCIHSDAYDSFVQFALGNPRARYYLPRTRTLVICECHTPRAPQQLRVFAHTIPLVLGHAFPLLQCVTLRGNPSSLGSLYHRSFITCMAAWRELRHLDLQDFTFHSITDLCRILVSLPKLSGLTLSSKRLIRASSTPGAAPRVNYVRVPSLRFLSISTLDSAFLSLFLGWLTSTTICSEVRGLELLLGFKDDDIPASIDSLVKAAGSFLRVLSLQTTTPLDTGMKYHSAMQCCSKKLTP